MRPYLIVDHAQKTPYDITDHQYLNITEKPIIDDKIGEPLKYRHLIKRDNHKKTRVKYFANELGHLVQGLGDRVKDTNTIISLEHEKIPTYRRKDVNYFQIVCNY